MARRSAALILAEAQARGAISERRADELGRAVAAGQDISWVDGLTGTRGPAPARSAVNARSYTDEQISDDQADQLWPPRSESDAQQRFRAAEAAAAARRGAMSDDQLYSELFAAAPGHQQFTGTHTHEHPAYQQGNGGPEQHSHVHEHYGDANHDHEH